MWRLHANSRAQIDDEKQDRSAIPRLSSHGAVLTFGQKMDRAREYFWKYVAAFVVGTCVQIYRVVVRRKNGQSWTEALANSNKLTTGSVWKDAALLAAILLLVCATLFAALWK